MPKMSTSLDKKARIIMVKRKEKKKKAQVKEANP